MVDVDELARAVLAHAAARPGYVYGNGATQCYYMDVDAWGEIKGIGCLFGHAMVDVGVDQNWLARPSINTRDIEALFYALLHNVDTEAETTNLLAAQPVTDREKHAALVWRIFDAVQQSQDNGKPWGESVEPLREYLMTGTVPAKFTDEVEED